jgi:hypothetical protein
MFILVLLMLVLFVQLAQCWHNITIPVPLLQDNKLSWNREVAEASIQHLADKKIVWIMGKFKVGKSFLTDYIRNDAISTNDPLQSTIGLNVWYDDYYAIIDTEGMMQPIGENNIYFLKEFLMSLMTRAADTLVTMTDQMDIIDMEFYNRFRSIYWNTNIASMYHIHNCKSLSESKLTVYQTKIQKELGLNERNRDNMFRLKQVEHLFLPNLKDSSILDWFKRMVGARRAVDILGREDHVRQDLDISMYLSAVDDSLLALGLSDLNTMLTNTEKKQVVFPLKSALFPPNSLWCKEAATSHTYYLFIQTTKLNSVSVLKGDKEIKASIQQLAHDFRVNDIDLKITSPVPLVGDATLKCLNTDLGYAVVKFKVVALESQPVEVCREIPAGFVNCNSTAVDSDWSGNWNRLVASHVTLTLN